MIFSDRSLTAEAAALARAIGTTDASLPTMCADHLARRVVHPVSRFLLRSSRIRRLLVRLLEWVAPGLYAWHSLRTGYFDGHLRRALASGVRQVVLLGAGLDTRATRLCGEFEDVTVYEVDRTTNAARKSATLARLGVEPRATRRLVHATIGDEGASLTDLLVASGFDQASPTFVLAEGLVMYLDDRSRDALFHEVAGLADAITFAFDFVDASSLGASPDHATRRLLASTHAVGETYRSGLDAERLDSVLDATGLVLTEHLGPDALVTREWGAVASPYAVSSCSAVAVAMTFQASTGAIAAERV